jgi:hypothetical protein
MRIIGAAEAVIMPTIITVHMTNTNANSIACHGVCGHVGPEPQQVAPRQRGQQCEYEDDDNTVAPEHGCLGGREIENLALKPGVPKLLRNPGCLIFTGHRRNQLASSQSARGD